MARITIKDLQNDFSAGVITAEKRNGYTFFKCSISGARWAVVKANGAYFIVYEVLGGDAWSYSELEKSLKHFAKEQEQKAELFYITMQKGVRGYNSVAAVSEQAARDIVFSKIGADWGFIYNQQEWDESDNDTEKANFLGCLN